MVPQRHRHAPHRTSFALQNIQDLEEEQEAFVLPRSSLSSCCLCERSFSVDLNQKSNPSPRCNGLQASSIAIVRDLISSGPV